MRFVVTGKTAGLKGRKARLALWPGHDGNEAFSATQCGEGLLGPSGVITEVAAERVWLLHKWSAGHDIDDVPVVLTILHVLRRFAANDDDRTDQLMILGTEMHLTDGGVEGLALLIGSDDIRRIEVASLRDHARPDGELHVGVVGTPFGLVVVLFIEGLDERLGERIFVLQRPPEVGGGIDAFGELRPHFLRQGRDLVGDDHLHLRG